MVAVFCWGSADALRPQEQSVSVLPDRFSGYDTIFVAQIEDIKPDDGCSTSRLLPRRWPLCAGKTTTLVTHVLKGNASVPTEFEAVIPPWDRFGLDRRGWAVAPEVVPHRQYMIIARSAKDLKAAFQSPEAVLPLHDDEDTVEDVELILRDTALTVEEKIAHLVKTLVGSKTQRSAFLAGYAIDLLDHGSESETSALFQTIEDIGGRSFSNSGEWTLLFGLWELSQEPQRRPAIRDRTYRVFVRTVALSLVTMPDHVRQGEQPEPGEGEVRRKFVPIIRGTAEGETALRAAFQSLTSDSEHRLTSVQKGRAREWLRILNLR